MELINYTLTSIVSFLGLVMGIILAYIAKEELKIGKKYFILLQKVILTLVLSLFFYLFFFKSIFLLILSLLAFFVLALFFMEKIKTYHIYPLLAVIFFLSSKNMDLFKIQAFLIFLYGFPTGSLLINIKKKDYVQIVLKHISFVVIALFCFLFF